MTDSRPMVLVQQPEAHLAGPHSLPALPQDAHLSSLLTPSSPYLVLQPGRAHPSASALGHRLFCFPP